MGSAPDRVFVARLSGVGVFDPLGDQVGRVRDVVVRFRTGRKPPNAVGLVVEVPGRRRVFLPMGRVTGVEAGQVITTGLVNMRRFEQRSAETLVLAELLDRTVVMHDGSGEVTVEDVAIEPVRAGWMSRGGASGEWHVSRLFVRRGRPRRLGRRLRRRGETLLVELDQVSGLAAAEQSQGATNLLAAFEELKAADLADVLHEMSPKRRAEVAVALTDERLADVLEELPEDDQVEILSILERERAAHVLEAMQPDDAADLLSELTAEQAERFLQLMPPDEAAPLRRLLTYAEDTAGGIMTTEPVILGPEATIGEALALVRRAELSPALAAGVYVCRPPLETPTGRFLGMAHIQALLREPPHAAIGTVLDKGPQTLTAEDGLGAVTRHLATYNLVAAPVLDQANRLIGVVTVDDVLDHLLPDDWRESDDDHPPAVGAHPDQSRDAMADPGRGDG